MQAEQLLLDLIQEQLMSHVYLNMFHIENIAINAQHQYRQSIKIPTKPGDVISSVDRSADVPCPNCTVSSPTRCKKSCYSSGMGL